MVSDASNCQLLGGTTVLLHPSKQSILTMLVPGSPKANVLLSLKASNPQMEGPSSCTFLPLPNMVNVVWI